jgi:hypothetical protein
MSVGREMRELSILLWAVWDPIGDVPLDEYDGYAPSLLSELLQEEDERLIASLREIRGGMGLDADDETDRRAAAVLRRWHYWRYVYPRELKS